MSYREGLVNNEAEEALLGSLFIGPSQLPDVISPPLAFQPAMFHSEQRQDIFKAMLTLYRAGKPCDYLLLAEEIEAQDRDYLLSLMGPERTWLTPNAPYYAELVKVQWKNRVTADLAAGMVRDAHDGGVDWQGVQQALAGLHDDEAVRAMSGGDAIISLSEQEWEGRDTGYGLLDWATGGFTPGHLWVVDGFTSSGKTMFALNLVYKMLKQGISVAYFSMEAAIEELALRLLGIRSGVAIQRLRYQRLTEAEQERRAEAENWLAEAPVRLYDSIYDVTAIGNEVRELQIMGRAKVVVVDYLQSLRWEKLYEGMTHAALSLQALAKDTRCTVVAVSQISNSEAQSNKDSEFFSQKGSGDIRDKADKCVRLRRKRGEGEMDAHLLKNRQGPAGDSFPLFFNLENGRITDMEKEALNV